MLPVAFLEAKSSQCSGSFLILIHSFSQSALVTSVGGARRALWLHLMTCDLARLTPSDPQWLTTCQNVYYLCLDGSNFESQKTAISLRSSRTPRCIWYFLFRFQNVLTKDKNDNLINIAYGFLHSLLIKSYSTHDSLYQFFIGRPQNCPDKMTHRRWNFVPP